MPRLLIVLVSTFLVGCIDSQERAQPDGVAPTTNPTIETLAPDTSDPGEPCETSGEQRCTEDRLSLEICDDETHLWDRKSCGVDRACIDYDGPHCTAITGDSSCRDTLYCFIKCYVDEVPDREECGVDCFVRGTATAQQQLDSAQSCMHSAGCDDEEELRESLECSNQLCGGPLAACFFPDHGGGTCAGIIGCREACGEDVACARGCGLDAEPLAQADYVVLELCLLYACAADPGNNCAERHAAGVCSSFATECAGFGLPR